MTAAERGFPLRCLGDQVSFAKVKLPMPPFSPIFNDRSTAVVQRRRYRGRVYVKSAPRLAPIRDGRWLFVTAMLGGASFPSNPSSPSDPEPPLPHDARLAGAVSLALAR